MVACPSEDGNEGTECNKADKPVDRIACNIEPCPAWNTGGWSEVSISVTRILNSPVFSSLLTLLLNYVCSGSILYCNVAAIISLYEMQCKKEFCSHRIKVKKFYDFSDVAREVVDHCVSLSNTQFDSFFN
jgi:hypothetical protein